MTPTAQTEAKATAKAAAVTTAIPSSISTCNDVMVTKATDDVNIEPVATAAATARRASIRDGGKVMADVPADKITVRDTVKPGNDKHKLIFLTLA